MKGTKPSFLEANSRNAARIKADKAQKEARCENDAYNEQEARAQAVETMIEAKVAFALKVLRT